MAAPAVQVAAQVAVRAVPPTETEPNEEVRAVAYPAAFTAPPTAETAVVISVFLPIKSSSTAQSTSTGETVMQEVHHPAVQDTVVQVLEAVPVAPSSSKPTAFLSETVAKSRPMAATVVTVPTACNKDLVS